MTKGQAIAHVAAHFAALIHASSFEEAAGVREEDVSEADAERLELAIEVVANRLYKMGTHPRNEETQP